MVNVAHSTLPNVDLHEPKGVSTATSGQVYVANGSGSGAWSAASTILGITGQISDFATPVAPTGWLECNGSSISSSTFAGLYAALTIQGNGSTHSNTTVDGLASTTHMRAGYFVDSTNIPAGTTIVSVDSATAITISAAATGTATLNIVVSPYPINVDSSTFTLPDSTTSGRYRRSRTATVHLGVSQADANKSHSHGAGTYAAVSDGAHSHGVTQSPHSHNVPGVYRDGNDSPGAGGVNVVRGQTTDGQNANISIDSGGTHGHTISGTSGTDGGTEARPLTLVVMTCIKT